MTDEQKKSILKLIRKATKYKLGYKQIKNRQLQEVVEYCNINKPIDLPVIQIPQLEEDFEIIYSEMLNILLAFYEVEFVLRKKRNV